MTYYVNENIKKTERIFPPQERYNYYRYDMNENPEGLPEEFVQDVLKEITPDFLSIYPEPDAFLKKYASYINMPFDNVLATNGSDMAIRYLLEVFGEKDKEVVTVSPSFEMYWVNCSILGLKHVPVAYSTDMTITSDKICSYLNNNTRVVVLLNPNNPIGNVYTTEEVEQIIIKSQESGAVVIIDEAYHYFYDKTFLEMIEKYNNVIILRTFSKLFSLAACRLGVIISNPTIIQYVKNAKLTFDVNSFALLFGEKILERNDIIDQLIASEKEGKEYTLNELIKFGYECRDCRGNFILIKTKKEPHWVEKELKETKKILVHSYNNELLKPYLRVSVGSKNAMELFLNAFLEIDN